MSGDPFAELGVAGRPPRVAAPIRPLTPGQAAKLAARHEQLEEAKYAGEWCEVEELRFSLGLDAIDALPALLEAWRQQHAEESFP